MVTTCGKLLLCRGFSFLFSFYKTYLGISLSLKKILSCGKNILPYVSLALFLFHMVSFVDGRSKESLEC